ncbi:MAG: SusC/RagA family TonB-linked outer membrane protein [Tannerellaceae bacterium]|jgi:TonB-linked SusC/RagA family outer membrane protein|nr:SusC/RagA family TonB-linked outer membrane protein [Tannerellaceae bacterium]
MKNYKAMLLILALGCSASLMSQIRVSGTVVDDTGYGLPGVNVVVKGSATGVATDLDGKYQITAPSQAAVLVFSYIGYLPQEITVGTQRIINLTLREDVNLVDEVIVVGYGNNNVKDLTSSITTLSAEDISKTSAGQAMNALQGKVAGLQVVSSGRPGEMSTVRLRGVGSYPNVDTNTGKQLVNTDNGRTSADDAPLYVVDGIFYENIDFLNSSDIATLSVLKDAYAAAIYGVRAANGVVLIETKSGGFDKKTEIAFAGSYGVQRAQNILKMANSEQFVNIVNESGDPYMAAGVENAMLRYGRSRVNPNVPVPNTDWYKEILRLAPVQNYNLDISGGSSKVAYTVGTNLYTQQGILDMKNDYTRYNFRSKLDFKATDWLTVGSNILWSQATQYLEEATAWNVAYYAYPIMPIVDDSDPSTGFKYANAKDLGFRDGQNPFPMLDYSNRKHLIKNLLLSVYAKIDLIPEKLSFRTSFNNSYRGLDERNVLLPYDFGVGLRRTTQDATLTRIFRTTNDIAWDNILTYNASLNSAHNFTVMLGSSYRDFSYQQLKATGIDFPYKQEESWYLDQTLDRLTAKDKLEGKGDRQYTFSYFGRISYNYKHRYLLYATMRADGSSKYQEKWGYFPSVGAGWVISEEAFMQDSPVFDLLKLRAGWGQLGNENIPASNGSKSTDIVFGAINDNRISGTTTTDAFSYLKWELTEELNFGISTRFLNNRLGFEADYFIRDTKDAAIKVKVPFVDKEVLRNVGVIRNSGFEFALNWDDRFSNKWSYNINLNLSTLKNEIRDLYGQPYIDGGTEEFRQRSYVGQPLLAFYGYKVTGVYQNQAEIEADPIAVANGLVPGDLKFQDSNGDGILDGDDRIVLGSYFPQLMYGANLGIRYSHVELSLGLSGQSGNKILNRKRGQYIWTNDTNIDADLAINRWHGEGTSNTYPSSSGLRRGWNQKMSDFFVEDGSYFRIQNIQLAYHIVNGQIGGYKLPTMKLSLTADRPLTQFNYNGFSPEIPYGLDTQTYPVPATYMVGLNVKF